MYSINNPPSILPLGNQGESNAREITFDVSSWLAEHPSAVIGITYLRPQECCAPHPAAEVSTVDGITRWLVGAHALEVAGSGTVVVRCMQGEVEVRSAIMYSTVAAGHAPAGPVPDAMEDYVADILQTGQGAKADALRAEQAAADAEDLKAQTEAARDFAAGHAQEAQAQAEIATVKADEASESEQTATEKAGQADQALSDLLAMLGSHVATLGPDGKLTPAQIPPISINDVFPVANTAEMVNLVAERGDTAVIMTAGVVTDCYILMTDDPTTLTNWAKLGVSYVANAGHATTADSATDSERINGKRIISMTQAQYDNATKDPDTLYAVTPGGD